MNLPSLRNRAFELAEKRKIRNEIEFGLKGIPPVMYPVKASWYRRLWWIIARRPTTHKITMKMPLTKVSIDE